MNRILILIVVCWLLPNITEAQQIQCSNGVCRIVNAPMASAPMAPTLPVYEASPSRLQIFRAIRNELPVFNAPVYSPVTSQVVSVQPAPYQSMPVSYGWQGAMSQPFVSYRCRGTAFNAPMAPSNQFVYSSPTPVVYSTPPMEFQQLPPPQVLMANQQPMMTRGQFCQQIQAVWRRRPGVGNWRWRVANRCCN